MGDQPVMVPSLHDLHHDPPLLAGAVASPPDDPRFVAGPGALPA
ncbi:hypothetical protein OG394_09945 [Kribbella sp. NBC_01245]|nr:hypothetical protein [Kribbella sp. NBC_01245]